MNERVRTSIESYMKNALNLVAEAKLWANIVSRPSFANVLRTI